MSFRCLRSLLLLVCVGLALVQNARAVPMQRKEPKVVSTLHSVYRLSLQGNETGTETIDRVAYDDNTIHFSVVNKLASNQGVGMDQEIALVVEEESYFPRTLDVVKTITQGTGSFQHTIKLEMVSNVAVLETAIGTAASTKRIVVPAGIAVQEMGVLVYWYQILFWYDRDAAGRQRFQWFEPVNGTIGSGEIFVSGKETITVMGRKTPVTVFTVEREKLGSATLKVDAKGRIVAGEQNATAFELVKQTEK